MVSQQKGASSPSCGCVLWGISRRRWFKQVLHLSVSRSDALADDEDMTEAEVILRAHEPGMNWADLKVGTLAVTHHVIPG